ncbi:MAG: acyl carrier protein [Proteobacteria bacterium]|nr:acyl carrier protein [Pseudomonadota bacterium]
MISDRLKRVILKTLDLDDFEFQDATKAGDVPGWDSLSHVKVILAVEKEYGLRFKTMELLRLKNVGDLQVLVSARTGSR